MAGFPGNQLDRFSWRMLERAGITTDYALCKVGPEEVFMRILKMQGYCSLDFYYNMIGYLIDMDPKEIANDEEINRQLQRRLRLEGLI